MARKKAATSTANASSTNYATPALDKGLDILECLAHGPSGATMSELARTLNRTVSEIFRMLLCLERRGYIAQVAQDRYSLTLKLFKLVQEHPSTERILVAALPVMQRLAHDTLQSCHLGVLEGDHIVILAQVNAQTNLGFYVKVGSTVDIMDSASGYVILAHQNAAQRAHTVANWSEQTNRTPPSDLESHLESLRRTGHEKRASYLVKGIVNISFPIFDEQGSPLGALTVPYIDSSEKAVSASAVTRAIGVAAVEITAAIASQRAESPDSIVGSR
jgi:DNA-binding IclR family transcriptional regulator